MFNVCSACGVYRADKIIDSPQSLAICPECGHAHPFRSLPLLILSGASGTGKSTVCNALLGKIEEAIVLDADILWSAAFDRPDEQYRSFFEQWLRLCKNINQAGRPVVLCGAGCGVPANLENCVERRYFSTIHYLALVCEDEVIRQRLRARPTWRQSGDEAFITSQLQFNRWFKQYDGQPPICRLDTSMASLDETSAQVATWIREHVTL